MRSTYGAPQGSSLEDWPISYDDLEPFYEKAEYEIGISGDYSGTPFHGPRKRPLPMPPLPPGREFADSGAGGQAPRAASVSHSHGAQQRALQRPRPLHALPLVLRVCLRGGRQERLAEYRHSHCAEHRQLRTAHRVHGEGDPDRRAGTRPRRRLLRRQRPSAGAALPTWSWSPAAPPNPPACCSIRKAASFPTGSEIATTRSAAICRAITTPAPSATSTSTPTTTWGRAQPSPSATTTTALPACAAADMLANEFIRLPIHMIDRLPPDTPRWGLGHKQAMRHWHKRTIVIMGPTQQIPTAEARVTLDPTVRDKWGMPVVRISGNVHPHTFEIGEVQAKRAEAWLKEAGAVSTSLMAGKPETGFGRPAPGRNLPHGQRSARLGGQPELPDSRRRQCFRHRLQRARDQRRLQSGADHHGHRLLSPPMRWSATGRARDSGHEAILRIAAMAVGVGGSAGRRRHLWRVVLLHLAIRPGLRKMS